MMLNIRDVHEDFGTHPLNVIVFEIVKEIRKLIFSLLYGKKVHVNVSENIRQKELQIRKKASWCWHFQILSQANCQGK